jgi:N6-adenosine-specific RNA methylase IME4
MNPERLRALRPETVKQLAESMKVSGLLQPIVLRPKAGTGNGYWLVAGRHRFEAAKKLKWDSIRAAIYDGMDLDQAELAEIDENLIRADLSPAEQALHIDARKTLYEKLHPETVRPAGPGRGKKNHSQNESGFVKDTAKQTGKGRSTVARSAQRGKTGRTWLKDVAGTSLDKGDEIDALINLPSDQRDAVIARAKDGEKVSAKTEGKKASRAKRESELADKITALPNRLYGVIVADPEWKDDVWSEETGMNRHPSNHYPTSDAAVIAARDVPSISAKDCVLFLWTPNQHLRTAIGVMEAWGFTYKSNYCWGKDRVSTGFWNRSKHELLLIGTRGHVPCPAPGTQWESLIMAPKGAHSAKPECFLEMIEQYFPNIPKIELNRRGPARPGWDAWGNELEAA